MIGATLAIVPLLTAPCRQGSREALPQAPGRRIPLAAAELFLPEGWNPLDGKTDLVVHFHGSPEAAERSLVEAAWNAALVAVSRKGFSKVYEAEFADPRVYRRLLEEALDRLREEAGDPRLARKRLVLSSFSAGYAAVREVLKRPQDAEGVDVVVLLDSLHAGYGAKGELEPAQMAPFRAFARRAAKGEKVLWSTHSAIVPPGYASARETNDDLLATVGATRRKVSGERFGGIVLSSRADRGGLHVLGTDGLDAAEHVRHFRALAAVFAEVGRPIR